MKEGRTPPDALDMEIDGGYISPIFATETTDDGDKIAVLREVLVVIHEEVLSNALKILPLMEHAIQSSKALLFVGGGVRGDALQNLVVNVDRGCHPFAAVTVSGCGASRRLVIDSIAAVTGGMVIDENLGLTIENLTTPRRRDLVLGTAKMVRIGKTITTIFEGGGERITANRGTPTGIGGTSARMGVEKSCEHRPETLRPARDERIRKAVRDVYEHAQQRGMKPPNVKEIGRPVQQLLGRDQYHASAEQVQRIASEQPFPLFRRKPGPRVNRTLLPFSLEGWEKSGQEM